MALVLVSESKATERNLFITGVFSKMCFSVHNLIDARKGQYFAVIIFQRLFETIMFIMTII